jgi:hypothetical protein
VKNITYCASSSTLSPLSSPSTSFSPPSLYLSYIYLKTLIHNVSDLAKVSPHILSPERFAVHLGVFLVSKYSHIDKADVKVEQLKWKRILVPGEQKDEDEHSHAFWRDGEDKRIAKVIVRFVFLVFSIFLFLFLLFRWGGIFAFGGLL